MQGHRHDLFPLLLEDADQGEQGVAAPLPAGPVLYGCVIEHVDGQFKPVNHRRLLRQTQDEVEALVAAGGLSLVVALIPRIAAYWGVPS